MRRALVLGLAEAVGKNFVQNGQKIMFLCFAYLFVTDDVIVSSLLHHTGIGGNTQLGTRSDIDSPMTRAQTTSSDGKATASGSASGKGRCLITLISVRDMCTFGTASNALLEGNTKCLVTKI